MRASEYSAFLEDHRIVLAPMAGVTDAAMRLLCREQGARFAFCEMVSAKGLSYGSTRTADLIDIADDEVDIGVQLFGHEADTMLTQARAIADRFGDRLACIDINMGCPARKIVSKGDGAALMTDPDNAVRIVDALAEGVEVPITAKLRRGFDLDDETAPQLARRLADAGAAGITIHGRFARQMYHGTSDATTIARVVDAVDVPVIGNGDITCGADAVAMLRDTGCSAVMVARAAEGNPWVFADIDAALSGRPAPASPDANMRIDMARRHARLAARAGGHALIRMRKHTAWYLKGLPGASVARARANTCSTLSDFEELFDSLSAAMDASDDRTKMRR